MTKSCLNCKNFCPDFVEYFLDRCKKQLELPIPPERIAEDCSGYEVTSDSKDPLGDFLRSIVD
jgi:hypothetical protein